MSVAGNYFLFKLVHVPFISTSISQPLFWDLLSR